MTEVNIGVIDAAGGGRTTTAVALTVEEGVVKVPVTGDPVLQSNL